MRTHLNAACGRFAWLAVLTCRSVRCAITKKTGARTPHDPLGGDFQIVHNTAVGEGRLRFRLDGILFLLAVNDAV